MNYVIYCTGDCLGESSPHLLPGTPTGLPHFNGKQIRTPSTGDLFHMLRLSPRLRCQHIYPAACCPVLDTLYIEAWNLTYHTAVFVCMLL